MSGFGEKTRRDKLKTQLADEFIGELSVIVLIQGVLQSGSPHYAYARMLPERFAEFRRAEASGAYRLSDFGEILEHGAGLYPTEDVRKRIEQAYAADHRFEESLCNLADATESQPQLSGNNQSPK